MLSQGPSLPERAQGKRMALTRAHAPEVPPHLTDTQSSSLLFFSFGPSWLLFFVASGASQGARAGKNSALPVWWAGCFDPLNQLGQSSRKRSHLKRSLDPGCPAGRAHSPQRWTEAPGPWPDGHSPSKRNTVSPASTCPPCQATRLPCEPQATNHIRKRQSDQGRDGGGACPCSTRTPWLLRLPSPVPPCSHWSLPWRRQAALRRTRAPSCCPEQARRRNSRQPRRPRTIPMHQLCSWSWHPRYSL